MTSPSSPPVAENVENWRKYAIEFLQSELRDACPDQLGSPHFSQESPLEGEGAIVAFPFVAEFGTGDAQKHWVVVGETEPNYYPHYELEPADVFSLHWGTRFMSVLAVPQCKETQNDDYDAAQDARDILNHIAPNKPIEQVDVDVTFDVDGQRHTVLRCRLDDETIYIFGRDAPPGFSRCIDLPPHVAYRIHLGRVLLREPEPTDETQPRSRAS